MKDYIDTDLSAEEVSEKMVGIGTAVEDVTDLSENTKNVVVGKILSIEKHPDADKLQICMIDIGQDEPVQIVTGAHNISVGDLVPVALHGSMLPNGVKIKKGKLRGVSSNGMLCSGEELCLKEADYPGAEVYGILILKEDYAPGTDINEVLMTDDKVIDFEILSNRPDCLSVLGLAREASSALDIPVKIPEPKYAENSENIADYVSVSVDAPDLCPRYLAKAIKNVKIAPSPEWMRRRLKTAGVRPINNIVDITNFVMLETGQPMHAFDAKDIRGGKIIVRRAANGEKLVTLDGKERVFNEKALLIADGEGAIGIAGIMGGENSEIKDDTETVIFESAKFMYGNIRQTARALGMSTEASMRFSKGVDEVNSEYAINRACQLVEMLGAGEVVGGTIDVCSADLSDKVIEVKASRVNELLGTDIPEEIMVKCLERVFIKTQLKDGKLICTVPHYRADMDGYADVTEEIARIYGYDNIPASETRGRMMRKVDNHGVIFRSAIKQFAVDLGFYEAVTYSFTGAAMWDKLMLPEDHPYRKAVKIINPFGDDTAYMRTTLVADMLTVISTNIKRKNKNVRLFELNKVFIADKLPLTDTLPKEPYRLVMGGCGSDMDFYEMKGAIENILDKLHIKKEVSFVAGGEPFYHPGRCARVLIDGNEIGQLGEIHPDVQKNFEISGRTYIAEIDIDALMSYEESKIRFAKIPKFPAIERDIAVVVDKNVEAGMILKTIMDNGGEFIESAELFDVYEGDRIEAGKKSIAYALSFRSDAKTLTDDEIGGDMESILRALKDKLGATLRD